MTHYTNDTNVPHKIQTPIRLDPENVVTVMYVYFSLVILYRHRAEIL
jgi:hypothetical protein